MRILVIHNFYVQSGGEDTVFRLEAELLRQHGHTVIEYVDDNERIGRMSRASVAVNTIWSPSTYKRLSKLLASEKPSVAHFHNFFPLISPSAYYACRAAGVPVVQTIHNSRLICPAASFYRDGKLCLDCVGRAPWPGILHACYHQSHLQSAVVASMIQFHRWTRTWRDLVDLYITSTEFYRDIFIRAGLPPDRIALKPHFVQDAPETDSHDRVGDYALFIGRLDPEKGVRTLLAAWKDLDIPLKIRGSGQLAQEAREFVDVNNLRSVEFVDRVNETELSRLIRNARFLVLPSEGYYETFGIVAIECYARGVPVIASRIGVMTEIVREGETGLLFKSGDALDLQTKVRWLWERPEEVGRMGHQARATYEQNYMPERNYEMLMAIYRRAATRVGESELYASMDAVQARNSHEEHLG